MTAARSRTYKPQPGGLAQRVVAFFAREPDERLSAADVALKFDVLPESVCTLLKPAVNAGILALQRNGRATFYELGAAALAEAKAEPGAALQAALTPATQRPPLPAAADLVVESGIPLPERRGTVNVNGFDVVWERMAVGDSVACQRAVVKRLFEHASKYGKARGWKFSVRSMSADESRIWRVA